MNPDRRRLLRGLAGTGLVPLLGSVGDGAGTADAARTALSTGPATAVADTNDGAGPERGWQWTDEPDSDTVVQDTIATRDGDVVAVGHETDASGIQHVSVRRIGRNGQQRWAETIGGTDHDAAIGVTEADDGDVVFCGGSASEGSRYLDTVIGRLDADGDLEWFESFGRPGTNDAAHAITAAADGGYVAAGGTHYVGGADGDGVGRLLKVDETGSEVWDRTYDDDHVGEIYDVVTTADGRYAFVGTRATSDSAAGRAWLGVVTEDGDLEWSRTYGGAGSRVGYGLVEADDGGFAFAGTTTPPGRNEPTAWVVKVGKRGDLEWEQTYGSGASDGAVSIETTPDGGYSLAGWTAARGADRGWLLGLDDDGAVEWEELYGDSAARFNGHQRLGDSYAVGGYAVDSDAGPTAWVLGLGPRYSFDGEIEYTRQTTSPLSPVTVQVTDPAGPGLEYEYEWTVTNAPDGSDPGLLHTSGRAHTALHPDEPGEYSVQVTIRDRHDDIVDVGSVTIDVAERPIEDEFDVDVDADTVAELVERYAPTLHFHEDETFFPSRYEAYVENAQLRVGGNHTIAENLSLLELGDPAVGSAYDVGDSEEDEIYFRGDEDDFRAIQEDYPSTVHASVTETEITDSHDTHIASGTYIALTYWCFYLFDPKKEEKPFDKAKTTFADHPTDTETVTILLDESGPQWIGAAQHFSGEYMRWEKIAGTDGPASIDVYPSLGAHSSFLVNTSHYPGGIPSQVRWLYEENDSTVILVDEAAGLGDKTESSITWRYAETSGKTYDLVVLSDEERWTEFGGIFNADVGARANGTLPTQRGARWDDTGAWMIDRMLPERDVLEDELVSVELAHFTIDTGIGAPSAFKIRGFNNPGKKPHTFVIDAAIDASESAGVERVVRDLPLGWDEYERIEISLEDQDLPSEGDVTVSVDVYTYDPDIATAQDRVFRTEKTASLDTLQDVSVDLSNPFWSVPTPERGSVGPIGTDSGAGSGSTSGRADRRVSPGETVDRSTTIENTGSEPHSFLVTLTAEGPNGEFYDSRREAETVVDLEPGESAEVELSWVVDRNDPEGTYELTMEAWLESDPDDRRNQLAEESAGTFTVEKPTGTLSVSATPDDPVLVVDGEPSGATPTTVELPVGTHTVVAIHDEYESVEESVEIDAGETTTLELELTPLESETGSGDGSEGNGTEEASDESDEDGGDENEDTNGDETDDSGDETTPEAAVQSSTEDGNGLPFDLSPTELGGMGAVSAGLLYLAVRMASDSGDE